MSVNIARVYPTEFDVSSQAMNLSVFSLANYVESRRVGGSTQTFRSNINLFTTSDKLSD